MNKRIRKKHRLREFAVREFTLTFDWGETIPDADEQGDFVEHIIDLCDANNVFMYGNAFEMSFASARRDWKLSEPQTDMILGWFDLEMRKRWSAMVRSIDRRQDIWWPDAPPTRIHPRAHR